MTEDLERFIEERFIRSSGPGGQNVNKCRPRSNCDSTCARLETCLTAVKQRLLTLAAKRVTSRRETADQQSAPHEPEAKTERRRATLSP